MSGATTLLRCCMALLLIAVAGNARAELRLHGLFSDHMVLQRDMPLRVWGSAAPGEAVQLVFRGQSLRTRADARGRWEMRLKPEPAGGPDIMRVSGASQQVLLQDLLVGEVWLCSGQSNMEWSLINASDGPADVAAADDPLLRHIKIAHRASLQPIDDITPTAWQASSPATAGGFSAVAWHFARRLRRELGVPVGLINASWGGSHLETWMSRQAIAGQKDLRGWLPQLPATNQEFSARDRAAKLAQIRRWQGEAAPADLVSAWADPAYDDRHWKSLFVPGVWESQGLAGFDGQVWYRKTIKLTAAQAQQAALLHLGKVDDCDETHVNGVKVGGFCGWDQQRRYMLPAGLLVAGSNLIAVRVRDDGGGGGLHGAAAAVKLQLGDSEIGLAGNWQARIEAPLLKDAPDFNDLPTLLFNGMLNPLVGYGMRGLLWYQGESNVPRAAQYGRIFPAFIGDLRQRWGQGSFPFYYVQLAAFLPLKDNRLSGSPWAELREAQRLTLAVPDTGMVVATDIGDAGDIHPRNKFAVGQRLAGLALRQLYGQPNLTAEGPTLQRVLRKADRIELQFANVGKGLQARGLPLLGFTIADASQVFLPAQASIVDDRVIVSHPQLRHPQAVRFGWVDNPQESNLFNSADLPAAPFRTDSWPLVTHGVLLERVEVD